MRIFLIGAIVLIVFGIIASASDSMQLWSVWWYTWFMASFLSYLVDLFTGFGFGPGGVVYTPVYGRRETTVVK
jgi:hypothetical protein